MPFLYRRVLQQGTADRGTPDRAAVAGGGQEAGLGAPAAHGGRAEALQLAGSRAPVISCRSGSAGNVAVHSPQATRVPWAVATEHGLPECLPCCSDY